MIEVRHRHPHLDPRQPRADSVVSTNPPVFAWKPNDRTPAGGFSLEVSRDLDFQKLVIDESELSDPAFLPEVAFAPGRYWWRWAAGGRVGEVFAFDIPDSAVVLEVPKAAELFARFSTEHPRLFLRSEDRDAFQSDGSGHADPLIKSAETLLSESHEIAEPEFLPDRSVDYQAFWKIWFPTMWDSRKFVKGAETLGLASCATGNREYARAAAERMASICRWDPEGSSYLGHNDEAHMSVIWHGAVACDFVWDEFTEDERRIVIEQFRRRGEITFEQMHDHGMYGITRFDSHAGREIVFLALIAIVFHEHIPDAELWLDWLRPVLCGIWPVWAGDDGGWAEGVSYSLPYVTIMTMFASALKRGAGVDLYRKPFWRNFAHWRRMVHPPYAEWIGFGDHTERWGDGWQRAANLVELIGRETGTGEFDAYVSAMRAEAANLSTPPARKMPGVFTQLFVVQRLQLAAAERDPLTAGHAPAAGRAPASDAGPGRDGATHGSGVLHTYPAVGWAAVRTAPEAPDEDVAFLFRSSPFGSISHSHANNNDFVLHVGGRVMLMPSGYYAGYGSDHHAHWVWHTKSHNCITLSGSPQLMRSHDSTGSVDNSFEDRHLVYLRGTADASYALRADRMRRHVVYIKAQRVFVLIDELVARKGVFSSLQWNAHSWGKFAVDEEKRSFRVERDGSSVTGYFLHNREGFFSLSDGWDPPPTSLKSNEQWHMQYNLRFTPSDLVGRRRILGTILCTSHRAVASPSVTTQLLPGDKAREVAQIGDDTVAIAVPNPPHPGDVDADSPDTSTPAATIADLTVAGVSYSITDDGIMVG